MDIDRGGGGGAGSAAAGGGAGARAREWRGPYALALYGAVAIAGALLDLLTKELVFSRIGPLQAVDVIPGFFRLIRSENTGAAFSILEGRQAFFLAVSVAAIALLSYFSWTAIRSGAPYQVALGLVASGVIGNFYDRVMFHHVRDFLDVFISQPDLQQWLRERLGTNHWPTFNVADSFICVGTAFLLVKFWGDEKTQRRHAGIHEVNRDSVA